MAEFVKGDVVVIPFPFSDLTHAKRRPALVVAEFEGDNLLLCQITSQRIRDRYAVAIDEIDFETGTLRQRRHVGRIGCLQQIGRSFYIGQAISSLRNLRKSSTK